MIEEKGYVEHSGRAIDTGGSFTHVMAITLDPQTNYREGIIRCITSRTSDPALSGNIDRSELRKIHGNSLEHFTIDRELSWMIFAILKLWPEK